MEELSFKTHKSRSLKTSSNRRPLLSQWSLFHNGLWPLKSPKTINGWGSCWKRWYKSASPMGTDGGKYMLQTVTVFPKRFWVGGGGRGVRGLVQGPSCSRAHLGHTAAELHLWAPCPYFWHLKQYSGLGINRSTFTLKYPRWISLGRLVLQKVKNKVFVSFSCPWSFLLTCLTYVTPC